MLPARNPTPNSTYKVKETFLERHNIFSIAQAGSLWRCRKGYIVGVNSIQGVAAGHCNALDGSHGPRTLVPHHLNARSQCSGSQPCPAGADKWVGRRDLQPIDIPPRGLLLGSMEAQNSTESTSAPIALFVGFRLHRLP